jgi:hypothetical protein
MRSKSLLHAGAGKADITPAMGIQLAGDIGRYRPTEEIRERLYARALVLESGTTRICLLALDLLAANTPWADEVRRRIAARFGFKPEHIIFHVEQNHAAPSLGHCFAREDWPLFPSAYPWLHGGDPRYNEPAVAAMLEAVAQATSNLQPVTLQAGRGVDGRLAFNRRFIMRDGSVKCHPGNCNPEVLYSEGPADPEVGILQLTGADGRDVSRILHFTSHPCHGYPQRFVIADWPGCWAEQMQAEAGAPCIPLTLNGCCGNIHHLNHLDPHARNDHLQMTAQLMETSRVALKRPAAIQGVPLAMRRTILNLPLRKLDRAYVRAAEALIAAHPEPMWIDPEKTRVEWDWVYAASTLDLADVQKKRKTWPYEIQALRIGDAAIVTLMGEPFVEAQLEIKLKSPAKYTFVAHFCNGYVGYIPTRAALARGGYETRASNWSRFAAGALETITRTALKLLRELY